MTEIILPSFPDPELIINTDKNDNIYFSTESYGIYKSSDWGVNWDYLGGPPMFKCNYISANNENILANCYDNSNIYLSTDRGNVWKLITSTTGDFIDLRCGGLNISSKNYIYVSISNQEFYYQLFSKDMGNFWDTSNTYNQYNFWLETSNGSIVTNICSDLYFSSDQEHFFKCDSNKYSYYPKPVIDLSDNIYFMDNWSYLNSVFDTINIRKWNPNSKLIIYKKSFIVNNLGTSATIVAIDSANIFIFYGNDIYKSTDDCDTWTKLTNFNFNATINDVCITKNKTIWLATSGGIIYSSDIGDSWHLNNEGLNTTEVLSIVDSRDGYLYLGMAADKVYISDKMVDVNENILSSSDIKIECFDKRIKIIGNDLIRDDIKIYYLLGELINNSLYSINSYPSGYEVNCGNLNTGVYIVNITNKGKHFSKPVLVY